MPQTTRLRPRPEGAIAQLPGCLRASLLHRPIVLIAQSNAATVLVGAGLGHNARHAIYAVGAPKRPTFFFVREP